LGRSGREVVGREAARKAWISNWSLWPIGVRASLAVRLAELEGASGAVLPEPEAPSRLAARQAGAQGWYRGRIGRMRDPGNHMTDDRFRGRRATPADKE
jgi:hypothetical protein